MFLFRFVFMCVVFRATFGQSPGIFFESGQRYTYLYRGEAICHHDTLPKRHTVFRLQCNLLIDMLDLSVGRLQVEGCQLRDDGTNLHKRSDEFAAAVQRYSMYFQLQNGTINKVFTDHAEPLDITNFKRGAISSVPFKQRLAAEEQIKIRQVFVQGACQTSYVVHDSVGQMERLVDLSSCETRTNKHSTSKCLYYISNVDSEPRLTSIECDETYGVDHLDFLGSLANSLGTTAKLRQNYYLLHVSPTTPTTSSYDFQHLASSKRVTTLAYEPTTEIIPLEQLQIPLFRDITDELNISAVPTEKAGELFANFADVLQRFDHNTLWDFLQGNWECTQCTPTKKVLRQSRLLDALMACGTTSCLETYARTAVEGYISGAKVQLFLLDAALKKKTSLPIIHTIFRLCMKVNDRGCWLNLGSMIHTYYEEIDPQNDQVPSEILTIVAYLHRIIGANCEPFTDNLTNRIVKHYDIVLTLKTIGNIGTSIQIVDRGLPVNEQVVANLLKCARNTNISHNVAVEAIQALRRMTIDDNLSTQLLGLLRSRIHSMIRIASYKILMKEPTLDTLKEVVGLVQPERSEHLKSYVVSHLNDILQSEDPAMTSLRSTLKKGLAEKDISLPKPLPTTMTLSHHKSIYKTFSIPNVVQPIGMKIDVDVIYDPSSRIPVSIRLNVTLNAFGRSLNLLDCGLSMQYIDDILRKLLGRDAEILLQFLGIPSFEQSYQHTKSTPQFNNIRRTILDNLQELDDDVTMGGVPDLSVDLRVLGNEIVFGNLNDLKSLLGLVEHLKHFSLRDLLHSFLEHDLRKKVNFDKAIRVTQEKTTLPTILGLPLTTTSSHHAFISLNPRLYTHRHERSKSLDFALVAGGFFNIKTKMAVSIPGFVETATSWSGHVNGSVDLNMKAMVEFSTTGLKLTFSNPFEKIKRDVFTISTRQSLITDGIERTVMSPHQRPIENRCSSATFYQISGIRICVGMRLPHERHHWLSFLPLSGPFTLHIGLESTQRSSQYTSNFVFLQQQYRRRQPGRSNGSSFSSMKVTLEGSKHLVPDVGRGQTTISVQAKGELLQYRSVDNKPAYKLDFSISHGGEILFDIKYYKTMHEEPLQSPVPSVFIRFPATVSINVSTPVAYLAMVGATLHRTPSDFSTQLNVTYFCADQTSFFYRLHIQPQRAYHPGHVTELSNKITIKGDRRNGTGWTEVTYLLKYPGQVFNVSTNTNFHPKSSVTDADVRWLTEDGTRRMVQAKSDLSTRATKKGVALEHVLTGSSDDWKGQAYWSLIRGRLGNVEVDFGFNVHSKGKDVGRTRRSAKDVFVSFLHLNKQASSAQSFTERGINKLQEINHSLRERIDSAVHGLGHLVGEMETRLSTIRNNVKQILGRVVSNVTQSGQAEIPKDLESEYGVRQRIRERKQYVNTFKQAVDRTLADETLFDPARHVVDDVFRGKETVEILQALKVGNTSNQWRQWSWGPLGTTSADIATNIVNISFHFRFRNVTLTPTALHPHVPLDYNWDINLNYPHSGVQQQFKTTGRYVNDTKIHNAQNSQALHMKLSGSQFCSDMTFDLDLHHRTTSLEVMYNLTNSRPGKGGFKLYQYLNLSKKPLRLQFINFMNSSFVKSNIKVKANATEGKGLQYGVYGDVSSPIEFFNFNIRDVGVLSSDVWKKSALTYHPYATTNRTLFLNRTYELLTFDVLNLRGFDDPLKLLKVWTPQASHTTVSLPNHDVAIHYLVDKSEPTYRNMTIYHETLSKEKRDLDISWQMALHQSHRLLSNMTVTPSGQHGLSVALDHIKQVTMVRRVTDALELLEHNIRTKNEIYLNCSPDEHRIGPDRPGELRDKRYCYSVRLPFEWNDFDAFPTLTHGQKGMLKRVKGAIQKLRMKEVIARQPERRYQTAMIFGAGFVKTFDGLLYEHPGYKSGKCTYILARDFVSNTFSILSTVDAVTLLLPNLAISIDGENRVAVNMSDKFIELPLTSRDGNAVIQADGPYVIVHTTYGVDVTCDSVNFLCLFNISEMYHNHTLGLLGTNDGEQLNDMRKPNGHSAAEIIDFVDAYEISGKAECLYTYDDMSRPASSRTSANDSSPIMCEKLFQDRHSSFSDCFRSVKPLSYMDFCVENTNNSDAMAPFSTLCSLSTAYVTTCRFRGVNIKHLESCASCNGRPAGAIWRQTIQKTADIVFIISRHANVSLQHDFNHRLQHLAHHIEHALVGREGYAHVRYGLVGFGGARMQGPSSFTIDGHLFGPYQEFNRVLRSIQYTDQEITDALEAIRFAASYPFRAEASRVIILVTDREREPTRPREPLVDVLHELQRNSIRFYTVSRYPDLTRRASVIGIRWNNQLLTNNRKTSVVVSDFPKGDYAKLSKTTEGSIFSLHHMIHSPITSRLYSHLSDDVRQHVAGDESTCRKCECLIGRAGEGVASCSRYNGEC